MIVVTTIAGCGQKQNRTIEIEKGLSDGFNKCFYGVICRPGIPKETDCFDSGLYYEMTSEVVCLRKTPYDK